jgi:hypothetical protein
LYQDFYNDFCTKHRTETIISETIQKRKTTSSFGGLELRAAKSAADPDPFLTPGTGTALVN